MDELSRPLMIMKNGYKVVVKAKADPRTSDGYFLFTHSITFVNSVCFGYLILTLIVGPRLMRNREPFQIKRLILAYNIIQVIFNGYIIWTAIKSGWFQDINFFCEPTDLSLSDHSRMVIHLAHMYYLNKLFDLIDTVFFVLRKKGSQISMLHCLHHVSVFGVSFGGLRNMPGKHFTFIALINPLVHMIMYFYYFMSALGPKYQKFLWWKKYLTLFQMSQFFVLSVQSAGTLLFYKDCDVPKLFPVGMIGAMAYLTIMFGSFYVNTFRRSRKQTLGINSNHLQQSESPSPVEAKAQ